MNRAHRAPWTLATVTLAATFGLVTAACGSSDASSKRAATITTNDESNISIQTLAPDTTAVAATTSAPATTTLPPSTTAATTVNTTLPSVPDTTAAPVVLYDDVTTADIENMVLPDDTCHGWGDVTEYRLVDGKFSVGTNFYLSIENAIYDDVDGDGAGDAVFVVLCLVGVNDSTSSAIVRLANGTTYAISDEALMSISALPPDAEMRIINKVSFVEGQVEVRWFALLPNDDYDRPWLVVDTRGTVSAKGFAASRERFSLEHYDPSAIDAHPDEHFEWADLTQVPQLGNEPVRGSGCGLDQAIGDTLPDGWWFGWPKNITATGFDFDLVCVYYGDEAHAKIGECLATDDDNCFVLYGEGYYPDNSNDRLRPVTKAPDFVAFSPNYDVDSCTDIPAGWFTVSIVHIVDGVAKYMRFDCVVGG